MSEPENRISQPIIIAGMHRSGTSLTASILQQAGVFIGENLLPANAGNLQGYFEDAAFYKLHKNILAAQAIDPDGWTTASQVEVPESFHEQAKQLCDRRSQVYPLWGWKEPRTTLFLNFWKQLLPQAKFVFPYRSPWEVIDSLFARGDSVFADNPNFAAEIWHAYNQTVLDFCQQYPNDCFLFHCDLLKTDETSFVEKIMHKLGLPLTVPNQRLFQPGVMHNQVNSTHRPALLALHFPATLALYETLQRSADVPSPQPLGQILPGDAAAVERTGFLQAGVLQDWRTSHRLSQQLKQLTTEMQAAQAERQQVEAQLQATQAQLAQAQVDLTHWQSTVAAMESNRFWQMRNAWVRLKKQLNLGQRDSSSAN